MHPRARDTYSASPARNHRVDRLRALCVFLVVNMHYSFAQIPYPWLFGDAGYFKPNGFYGVTMFFVISGFLITSVSLHRWKRLSNIPINDFYVMRAARILPAVTGLLAVLLVLHAASVTNFVIPASIDIPDAIWHVFTFRYNYLLGTNNVPGMYSWNILWSLSVEELFYVCFPVLCLALRREKLIIGALFLFVITAPYGRLLYGNYALVASADSISLGCLAAIIGSHLQMRLKEPLPGWVGTVLRGAGAAIFVAVAVSDLQSNMLLAPTPISIGVAIYLLGASLPSRELPIMSLVWRPVEMIGRRSYEIYLIHLPVLFILLNLAGAVWPTTIIPYAGTMVTIWATSEAVGRYFTDPLNSRIRKTLAAFFKEDMLVTASIR